MKTTSLHENSFRAFHLKQLHSLELPFVSYENNFSIKNSTSLNLKQLLDENFPVVSMKELLDENFPVSSPGKAVLPSRRVGSLSEKVVLPESSSLLEKVVLSEKASSHLQGSSLSEKVVLPESSSLLEKVVISEKV